MLTLQQKFVLAVVAGLYLAGRRKGRRYPAASLSADELFDFHEILTELTDNGLTLTEIAKKMSIAEEDLQKILSLGNRLGLDRPAPMHIIVEHRYTP